VIIVIVSSLNKRMEHGSICNVPWAIALVVFAACSDVVTISSGSNGSGQTFFVDGGFDGISDGSAERPYKSIQEAVGAAKDGDTIAVSQGRYAGNIDLRTKTLTLLGGFAGGGRAGKRGDFATRDPRKTPSIVVGRPETSDYTTEPAAVFLLADSAGGRIDGFTITGGRHGIFTRYSASSEPLVIANNLIEGNGIDTPQYYEYGGGIHSEYKTLVLENNVIRGNKSGRGGGIAALGAGEARVEKNIIEDNVALGDHGGGIYLQQRAVVRGNVVRGNAVTAAMVNWMGGVGGGITVVAVEARLSENILTGNYAKKCGGGVFVDEGANVTMYHELVVRNRPAHRDGWGGSAIYVDGGSAKTTKLRIDRSTVADNALGGSGSGNGIFVASRAEVTVEHSIFWANGTKDDFDVVDDTGSSFVAASHSIWTGAGKGVRVGEGHLKEKPVFANPAELDYHERSRANLGRFGDIVD
jgi:Right handed beta helix region